MMVNDHDAIHSFSKKAYLQYRKLFPTLNQAKVNRYTELIFTLSAVIIFLIFAIYPTISTILELQKQLNDARKIDSQLEEKIRNLESLRQQYDQLTLERELLSKALPARADVALALGKIQTVAEKNNIKFKRIKVSSLPLIQKTPKEQLGLQPITTIFEIESPYNNVESFLQEVALIDRITTIGNITVSRDSENRSLIRFTISMDTYYIP